MEGAPDVFGDGNHYTGLLPAILACNNTLPTKVALVLMLAGALGNYLDRSLRGYVVDFIHVPHWPVFNVADIYVTAGAVLLAGSSLRNSTRHNPV